MKTDAEYMREALSLARMGWGLTNPNPMVGCVIVRDGAVIGRGFHRKAGEAHAEINALRDVELHGFDAAGATLYVTLEPCSTWGRTPPCTEAILQAGIARVVAGALDPNPKHAGRGLEQLRAAGVEVVCGVESGECCDLNRHFFRWITSGKPFVILKMAMTLDGRIATPDGESRWITGPEARRRVQQLRRLADAIMIGGGTLRSDHPLLTVREPENWARQPQRIIVSSTLTDADLKEYFPDGRAEAVDLPDAAAWDAYLRELGRRNCVAVLIEGGGELAAAALRADAVDMVEFHIAPKLLGGRESIPVLGGAAPEGMDAARPLRHVTVRHYGEDIAVSGYLREW
ncbi:MAG: bifunctional diaminohydroxyphosphoribosylaminopyrimidine deaminase/5-amino-6-(5-phosphoribosylamino)uracil reductase RibD [Lentisphaeria bacterium]|nr:bifunctional diaminohydroxyphosphoribosylaminopyrimidine deaminase/5-amino-6-(5-phosphoribosylamino)uracil reductase RibD [Lentisphaeria bacterium]